MKRKNKEENEEISFETKRNISWNFELFISKLISLGELQRKENHWFDWLVFKKIKNIIFNFISGGWTGCSFLSCF